MDDLCCCTAAGWIGATDDLDVNLVGGYACSRPIQRWLDKKYLRPGNHIQRTGSARERRAIIANGRRHDPPIRLRWPCLQSRPFADGGASLRV